MELRVLEQEFSICKLHDLSGIDASDEFYFLGKTDDELSLVCSTAKVPQHVKVCDSGWRAFRIEGTLDFSLVGILAGITALLAEHQIGVFAISTYNTDYVFTKKENFDNAVKVLLNHGYTTGNM